VPIALAAGIVAAFAIGGRLLGTLPDLPYNARELLSANPVSAAAGLAVALMLIGAVPMLLASLWQTRPDRFAVIVFPIVVAFGTMLFFGALALVPLESIDDIVGSPILRIGGTLERWLRFVALIAGPIAATTFGARLALGVRRRPGLGAAVPLLSMLLVSYVVVVQFAATNNITELLRGRGSAMAAAAIAAYLTVIGFVAALLGRAVCSGRRRDLLLALGAMLLSVPLTWQLVVIATNPRLEKYGRVFSARQFLLSPDRDHYLPDDRIALRFAWLQAGLSCVLGVGAGVARSSHTRRAQG
jgi:hypothetical protein